MESKLSARLGRYGVWFEMYLSVSRVVERGEGEASRQNNLPDAPLVDYGANARLACVGYQIHLNPT